MAARIAYRFDYIQGSGGNSVFIHGYSGNQAVNYSAVVRGLFSSSYVNITQGQTTIHVDGTVARIVSVQNLTPTASGPVEILEMSESF